MAPDDAQHAEGVAGQAWRREAAYRVGEGLPDLNNVQYVVGWKRFWNRILFKLGNESSAVLQFSELSRKIEQYALATSTTTKPVWHRLKLRKPCPTNLVGIMLEDQQREPWGVVVIDSSNVHACIDTNAKAFRRGFKRLTKTLESLEVLIKRR